jgi:hypothetical protein
MSNPAQIKIIHALKGALRLDDDTYRSMLSAYGAVSSKGLTFDQAKDLVKKLEVNAISAGFWKKRQGQNHSAMIGSPGYASWGQVKKICAMWAEVSRQPDAESKRKALNTFLTNHFGISFIEWLPQEMVSKVIRTLAAMRAQEQKKGMAA